MTQREYWNLVSQEKEFTTPFHKEAFSKFVDKDAVILDIGCGYGRTLHELHQSGYTNLLGMDFSSEMIKRGLKQYPELKLKTMNSGTIDLPDNTVDAVILFAVLTCISENDEQTSLIKEISRVLKPNGIIYINDFLLNTDERNITRYKKYEEKYNSYGTFELPEGAILRHHSEEWIKELLRAFKELEFNHIIFKTMNGHTSNGFYYFGQKQ